MKHRGLLLFCLLHACFTLGHAQDVYVYMTLHNLGCRQADHTYTGLIPNNGFDEGDRVELILAGTNGRIDAPNADGTPGGDDQLAENPGLPFAMNPASFTHAANTFYSPYAILIQRTGVGPAPALHIGKKFYVRAWDGASPATSTRYFNSQRIWQDFPIGVESCGVDSSVRTLRNQLFVPSLITFAVQFDAGHAYTSPQAPGLRVLAPNGGETWMEGEAMEIRWSGAVTETEVDILLRRPGMGWEKIVAVTANDGVEPWTVTLPGAPCSLRVQQCSDTTRFDCADSTFTLLSAGAPPVAPRVVIAADSTHVVLMWPRVPYATQYRVEHSSLYDASWEVVAVTPDTSLTVPVPSTVSAFRLFRVISLR